MAGLIRRHVSTATVKVHSAPANLMHNHIFTVAARATPLPASSHPVGCRRADTAGTTTYATATSAALIKYLHASTHTSKRRRSQRPEYVCTDIDRFRECSLRFLPCIGLLERLIAKSVFIDTHLRLRHLWIASVGKLSSWYEREKDADFDEVNGRYLSLK